METGSRKDGPAKAKRHSRHISYNRIAPTRSSTTGPLTVDDPLSEKPPLVSDKDAASLEPSTSPLSPSISSPTATSVAMEEPVKDLSYLLRKEIFHPLTQLEVPIVFRSSSHSPSLDTSIPDLLSGGYFRQAAIAAATRLTSLPPLTSQSEILSLFYIRLACLTLINETALAAQEVKALQDLSSSFYRHSVTNAHIVPWELRVLAVRLEGMGFGDARRGIIGYYDLAGDARTEIGKQKSKEEKEMWRARLSDLGIRVANALVEMGNLVGAANHLETLKIEGGNAEEQDLLQGRIALLYLKIGNLGAARKCLDGPVRSNSSYIATLVPLLSMAEGNFSEVVAQLTSIREGSKTVDPVIMQNLAVCLLYSGNLDEARSLLASLISEGESFSTLLFNMSTIFELCTDRSKTLKMDLAQNMASREMSEFGWEKSNVDFKL